MPITLLIFFACTGSLDIAADVADADIARYWQSVVWINLILLIFNVLPIYPLDGGQILQSLLWFVTSRGTSIVVASVIGIIGGVLLGVAASLLLGSLWILFISLFIVMQAWSGLQFGLRLRQQRGE